MGFTNQSASQFGLSVTVCHYPPGTSKWNPIEHHLFSEISKNWAGRPLGNYETISNYIRSTKTKSGLEVTAYFLEKSYEKGMKISDEQKEMLTAVPYSVQPKRTYTLHPVQSQIFVLGKAGCQRTKEQDNNLLKMPKPEKPEVIFA